MKKIYIAFLGVFVAVSANAVTVTLNGNGGLVEGETTKDYVLGDATLVLPIPVKTDYHFVGWFEDTTTKWLDYDENNVTVGKEYQPGTYLHGTNYSEIATTQATDLTLYAKWVKQSTYDLFHGKKLAIMGDSVSTLYGYPSPWGNLYYDENWRDNYGINEHSQWWGQIKDALGMSSVTLSVGGGSGVVCTTYEFGTERRSMMNYARIDELGTGGDPDLIIIAAGINNYNADTDAFNPNGVYLTNKLDRATTICSGFAEGYAMMLRRLKDKYPSAEIVALATYEVGNGTENGNGVITNTCPLYNVVCMDLRNLFLDRAGDGITYKVNGVHPGVGGLSAIANAFLENYAPIANPVTIPEAGHDWGLGKITTPATENSDGVRTYVCSHCQEQRNETVPYAEPMVRTVLDLTSQRSGLGVYLRPDGALFPVSVSQDSKSRTGSLTSIEDAVDGDEDTSYQDTTLAGRYISFSYDDPIVVTGVELISSNGRFPNKIYISDENDHLLGYTTNGIPWKYPRHITTIETTDRTPVHEVRISFDFEGTGRTLELKEIRVLGFIGDGKYHLTLDTKGGSVSDDATNYVYSASDETFVLPTPTRAGYHFIGWFRDDMFHYGKLLSGTPVTQVETGSPIDGFLYAKWISESSEFYQRFNGKTVGFMGDSISTFYSYPSPVYPYDFYTAERCADNGITERTTWWGQLMQACGMTQVYHDAISGSQLVATGNDVNVVGRAMMNYNGRLNALDNAVNKPEALFIFGGFNDYANSSATVDDFDPNASYLTGELDTTTTVVSGYAHGLALLIRRVKALLPDTELVMIAPYKSGYFKDDLCARGNATMTAVCNYFGVTCIDLAQSTMHVGQQPVPEYSGNDTGYMHTADAAHPNNLGFHIIADYIMETYTIPCMHENTVTNSVKVLPTCTEDGTNAVIYCNVCEKYISTATVIPALGHDLREDWTTNSVATCTADGERSRSCHRDGCDFGEEEVIPLLGHDWDSGEVTTEPTRTTEGVMTYTCGRCSITKTEPIPMLPSIDYLRNIALLAYAGHAPALPSQVYGLGADGETNGLFDVEWNDSAVSFDSVGTVVVSGTAAGIANPVTASVRIVEDTRTYNNIVNQAIAGNQLSPNDGWNYVKSIMSSENIPMTIQDIYKETGIRRTYYGGERKVPRFYFTWGSEQTISKVTVYYSTLYPLPDVIKFYSDSACTVEITTPFSISTPVVEPEGNTFERVEYTFAAPVAVTTLGCMFDLNEDEGMVYLARFWPMVVSGGEAVRSTAKDLADLKVDGETIDGFASDNYEYTLNGEDVTAATADANMGITILHAAGGTAYAVTLAEDGISSSKYTVNVTPEHEHTYGDWVTDPAPTIYTAGLKTRHCNYPGCHHIEQMVIPVIARNTNNWFNVVYPANTDGAWLAACGYTNYTPTAASAAGKDVIIRATMQFVLPNDATVPDTTDGVQTMLYAFQKSKHVYCFKAWNGSAWIELEGVEPTEDPVNVMIEIRYESAAPSKAARFTIGNTVLTDAETGAEWIDLNVAATGVSKIAFDGVEPANPFSGAYLGIKPSTGLVIIVR